MKPFSVIFLALCLEFAFGQATIDLEIDWCEYDDERTDKWCSYGALNFTIIRAFEQGELQFYNPSDYTQPLTFQQYEQNMVMQQIIMPWEAKPDYGTYQPWTIVSYNDSLYQSVSWSNGERPDTSSVWVPSKPEMHGGFSISLFVRFTRHNRTYHPEWIRLYNSSTNKDVAVCRFRDVAELMNLKGHVWFRSDDFRQVADGFYLIDFFQRKIGAELDSLQKKGILSLHCSLSDAFDREFAIGYKDRKVNQLVIMGKKDDNSEVSICDTLDNEFLKSIRPYRQPEFYRLGDALESLIALKFEKPPRRLYRPKKRELATLRQKVTAIRTRVLEEISTTETEKNFSLSQNKDLISKFNRELFKVTQTPDSPLRLFAELYLDSQKNHDRYLSEIVLNPSDHQTWHPQGIIYEGTILGYLGNSYQCIRSNFGKEPGTDPRFWKLLGPLSGNQSPETILAAFDIEISAQGSITRKELKALGWLDKNYPDYNVYLAFISMDDIMNYIGDHPELKPSWEKAIDLIAKSEDKFVRMIDYSKLLFVATD